ncbi:MAG: porin, partial [Ralstonia sp.]|nr:porin [Ralstonia sp.]
FVVGTDYALSKRTDAYFNLAYAKNSSGSGLGVLNLNTTDSYAGTTLGSTNFGNQNVYSSPAAGNANQFGATVGIRHKF